MLMGVSSNDPNGDNYDPNRPKWGEYFVSGNWCSSKNDIYAMPSQTDEKNCTQDNWNYGFVNNISNITTAEKKAMRRSTELDAGLVTTHSAQNAFLKVMASAGCSLDRDIIDERIVKETQEGKATFKGNKSQIGGIIDSQNDLKPAGAGDVPLSNYKMIAALAVKKGDLTKADLATFPVKHGLTGWAPTQGHIPSGAPAIGFVRNDILSGKIKNAMIIGKGSLFLGRMTNLFDGASFVIQANSGPEAPAGVSEDEVKKMIAKSLREFAATLLGAAE